MNKMANTISNRQVLIQNLLTDDKSAYVRVGCNPVGDI